MKNNYLTPSDNPIQADKQTIFERVFFKYKQENRKLSIKLSLLRLVLGYILTLSATAMATGQSQALTLIEEGKPRAIVVLPTPAPKKSNRGIGWRVPPIARRVIVENLQQMSGTKIKTYRANQLGAVSLKNGKIISEKVNAENYILIGKSNLTKLLGIDTEGLKPGGIVIKTMPNALVLMGIDDEITPGGTLYAVTTLLEKLGFRYLWPGELGKVVPKCSTVCVPPLDIRYSPSIRQRRVRSYFSSKRNTKGAIYLGFAKGDRERILRKAWTPKAYSPQRGMGGWAGWNRLGGNVNINGGHAFGLLYKEHGQEHPGWFALQADGSRKQKSSNRARLCVSNRELIDFIAKSLINKVKTKPSLKSVSLSPNDGGSDQFCICKVNALGKPGCITLDPPNSPKLIVPIGKTKYSLSDRYVWFWNQIAERVCKAYPNLLFTVDAYSVYTPPPVINKLHSNMVVRFACKLYSQKQRHWWNEWASMAQNIYWRPNNLCGPSREGVLEFNREYATSMKFAAKHNAIATDIDGIVHYWSTQGLNYYVLARVMWNPDADVDAIIDDYCKSGFGAAASFIREYFRQAEELSAKRCKLYRYIAHNRKHQVVNYRVDATAAIFTKEVIEKLRKLLESADKVAKDPIIKKRIAFLSIGLEFTNLQAQAYRFAINYKLGKHVDLKQAAQVLKQRHELMRKIFEQQPLAVNTAYNEFMNKGYFSPLNKAIKQ